MPTYARTRYFREVGREETPVQHDLLIRTPGQEAPGLHLREINEEQIEGTLGTMLAHERTVHMADLVRNQDEKVAMARQINALKACLRMAEHELTTHHGLTATDQPDAFVNIPSLRKWVVDSGPAIDEIRKALAPVAVPPGATRLCGNILNDGCVEDLEAASEEDDIEQARRQVEPGAKKIGAAIMDRMINPAPLTLQKVLRVLKTLGYNPPEKGLAEWLFQVMGAQNQELRKAIEKWKRAEHACARLAKSEKDALLDLDQLELEAEVKIGAATKHHLEDLRLVLFHQVVEQQRQAYSKRESPKDFFDRLKKAGG